MYMQTVILYFKYLLNKLLGKKKTIFLDFEIHRLYCNIGKGGNVSAVNTYSKKNATTAQMTTVASRMFHRFLQ